MKSFLYFFSIQIALLILNEIFIVSSAQFGQQYVSYSAAPPGRNYVSGLNPIKLGYI